MENIEKKIGEKIRFLRGNMTQTELARRVNVDKAIISKIETGKMVGSFECHKKLAQIFGLKLSELYAFFELKKLDLVEMRPGDKKTDTHQDFLEILTAVAMSKKMLPALITLKAGEQKYLEQTLKKVERFIIVLEGKLEIEVEGKIYNLSKDPQLEKGDSLYSRSLKRHRLKNTDNSITRALCVSSPPVL
ncbi:MAG: XRE family transcriptional regulator [Candidatus Omnitrophica bacterium]|nr:XRE family transcriptional regulator [Candidatus Omnitrophota bacterium]